MRPYLDLLETLLKDGNQKGDRTGTGTRSIFGHQMRFNLAEGFPLVTTKKMFLSGAIEELLWFISGSTDVKVLQEKGVHFWDSWVDTEGTIGHGYGKQFRRIESFVSVKPKIFDHHGAVEVRSDRTVFGVGYYGACDKKDQNYPWLVNVWRDMLRRCYYERSQSYHSYGGKGVHVDPLWHCFANFQRDAEKLPGWFLRLDYPEEYTLDKDVLWASNRYSKETCCWASFKEQSGNLSNSMYFRATSPSGEDVDFVSIGQANRDFGLNISAVHRCLSGKLRSHHGWTDFQYIGTEPGEVLRYRHIDQLKSILSEIRHNPDSRRLVMTLWNPQDMDRTTLPCCHGTVIQFYVHAGKLSCLMHQRSADSFLGLPVNIASYALLTHMMAQQADLEVGEFLWTGGDVHLYNNHVEQAKLQLSREPFALPKLQLEKAPSIFDYKTDHFTFLDYMYHPSIKADVSI